MINWGGEHRYTPINLISGMWKLEGTDSDVKIRYLSDAERTRLLNTINERADYMKPLIIAAMNTGIRHGSLFTLK